MRDTRAKVVLSTAWRLSYASKQGLVDACAAHAGLAAGTFIGQTPLLRGKPRSAEVLEWMRSHGADAPAWVAVDDLDLLSEASATVTILL